MKTIIPVLLFALFVADASCQDKKYFQRLESPFLVDTTSTMFFLIRSNEGPKISFAEHTSNIVVYDFAKDTYKRLFDKDVYIQRTILFPNDDREYYPAQRKRAINPKWVFYLVKNSDTNGSGRIDEKDASVLYVTDARGEDLQTLTTNDANVVNLTFYEKQGFALVEIQRDSDGDKSFKYEDKVFYYQKINLTDLSMGKPIEVGSRP